MKQQLAGLWLRGRTYWLAATIEGFGRVRVSLKTGDLATAITEAARVRAFPERYFNREAGDLVELFLTERTRAGISKATVSLTRYAMGSLVASAGPLDAVTAAGAARWWTGLQSSVKPRTAVLYLKLLVVFYRWAAAAGHVKASPLAGITAPKLRPQPRRVFLAPADALRVLDAAADPDLRFAIYCALHCGLRRGEIIAARPHWFDLHAGLLHVQNESDWLTKDRDNRTIPLTDEFMDFLAWYGIQSPYMFRPGVKAKATNKTGIYRTNFAIQFRTHVERLGLGHITFHDLRRTFASLHVSHGTPIYHVAKWLGDGVAIVEGTYGHLLPNDSRINDPWTQARAKGQPES